MYEKNHRVAFIAILAVIGLVALPVFASNMGFKVVIDQPLGSGPNNNYLAVPYNFPDVNPIDGVATAADLRNDMGGGANVANISRYNTGTQTWQTYNGRPATDFNLIPGEGLLIKVNTTFSYTCVGTHDPSATVTLPLGAGPNNNYVSVPYHSMSSLASELRAEMGGGANVANISRYNTGTQTWQTYNGRPATDFALVPGEALLVKVNASFTWSPSHY
jgi:hypothetical protein